MMRVRMLAGVLILAAAGGCSTVKQTMQQTLKTVPEDIARPATGTPGTFVREDGVPNLGTTCLTTLVDMQDKSTIELVRTLRSGLGDYKVTAGKYGVGEGQFLRVDCTTARPIGIANAE